MESKILGFYFRNFGLAVLVLVLQFLSFYFKLAISKHSWSWSCKLNLDIKNAARILHQQPFFWYWPRIVSRQSWSIDPFSKDARYFLFVRDLIFFNLFWNSLSPSKIHLFRFKLKQKFNDINIQIFSGCSRFLNYNK